MFDIMIVVVIGFCALLLTCLAGYAYANAKKGFGLEKVVISFLVAIGAVAFIISVSIVNSLGRPQRMLSKINPKVVYSIEARLAHGNKGAIVITDAEDPNGGFLMVKCNPKELPDANLVRLTKLGTKYKFIPWGTP